jgi:uncharacterized protein
MHGPAVRFVCAALLVAACSVRLIGALRSPQGRVNDFAAVLDVEARSAFDRRIRALDEQTTIEMAIVTVSSLDGLSIEEYASRLFAAWGIGKKDKDNGVLVLVAPTDRAVRIEVGYGLEGTIPDGLAGDIIRNQFVPESRAGRFAAGLERGVARIDAILRGDAAAALISSREGSEAPSLWVLVPFLGAFVAAGAFAIGLGVGTRTYGPILFGALFAGIPLLTVRQQGGRGWERPAQPNDGARREPGPRPQRADELVPGEDGDAGSRRQGPVVLRADCLPRAWNLSLNYIDVPALERGAVQPAGREAAVRQLPREPRDAAGRLHLLTAHDAPHAHAVQLVDARDHDQHSLQFHPSCRK